MAFPVCSRMSMPGNRRPCRLAREHCPTQELFADFLDQERARVNQIAIVFQNCPIFSRDPPGERIKEIDP